MECDSSRPKNHLFISSHLDDAVFSCGATMANLVERGERVGIFNLFSGNPNPPYSPVAKKLHKLWGSPRLIGHLRHAEDAAAVAFLGINAHYEDVPEAIYRTDTQGRWLYGGDRAMFGARQPDDIWLVPYFVGRIRLLFHNASPSIYAPLGIGGHVDHNIAFEIGLGLAQQGLPVLFYEDFPYAADAKQYQQRVATLLDWKSMNCKLDKSLFRLKIRAMECYSSQIPALFGDRRKMAEQVMEFAKSVGVLQDNSAERYWQPR